MSGSATEKARLRTEALARRDTMPDAGRVEAGRRVTEHVVGLLDFEPETIVSGFLPIRSEIDVRPLMAALSERGARLCLPAIVGGDLQFRHFAPGASLVPQGFGTSAPGEAAAVLEPAILLVPFAAFDRRLHRIGYGRGYYDRAIASLRQKGAARLLVGAGFGCQMVAAVPNEAHDVALDFIATEDEVLRTS